ncbi:MAG: redoxin domain-containing protein, partial [Alphaproteobacteria bacterium]|nr:redoxin domain-containing protein [Alphaproteobacteria bacterium]
MLAPGDPIPTFELKNQDGDTVSATDLRGRTTILFAFPKADTPGCTTQACGFRDEMPVIEAHGARVYGISPDRPKALKKWQLKKKL